MQHRRLGVYTYPCRSDIDADSRGVGRGCWLRSTWQGSIFSDKVWFGFLFPLDGPRCWLRGLVRAAIARRLMASQGSKGDGTYVDIRLGSLGSSPNATCMQRHSAAAPQARSEGPPGGWLRHRRANLTGRRFLPSYMYVPSHPSILGPQLSRSRLVDQQQMTKTLRTVGRHGHDQLVFVQIHEARHRVG